MLLLILVRGGRLTHVENERLADEHPRNRDASDGDENGLHARLARVQLCGGKEEEINQLIVETEEHMVHMR